MRTSLDARRFQLDWLASICLFLTVFCGTVLWGTVPWAGGLRAAAQDIIDPSLSIEGPEGQLLFVTAKYFDDQKVASTVSMRLPITEELTRLDFGHTGLQLQIVIPTSQPITVELRNGETVESKTSTEVATLEFSLGTVPAGSQVEGPRALPNAEEKGLARAFLHALSTHETSQIVSDIPAANIEWQTLDAYCEALNEELGDPLESAKDLDGWLSWEGSLGARVLNGRVEFEYGTCRFSLMSVDDKLVDVIPVTTDLPELWFEGPSDEQKYRQRAVQLAKALFEGRLAEARMAFSARYHEEITEESLKDLNQMLQDRLGNTPSGFEYKESRLLPYDPEARSRTLALFHAADLNTGKRCVIQVNVIFPCGPNIVAKGHVATINVRETWESAKPELAKLTRSVLKGLGQGDGLNQVDEARIHPRVQTDGDLDRLNTAAIKLREHLGGLQAEQDFDAWTFDAVPTGIVARGPVSYAQMQAYARLDFADEKLIGCTLLGPTFSFSTLDFVSDPNLPKQISQKFWQGLFQGELDASHALLAPKFREQMPADEFRQLIQTSQFSRLPQLKRMLPETVRLSHRLDRPLPLMTTVCTVAELQDGSFQPLRCEFYRNAGGELELLNFNTDFASIFPAQENGQKDLLFSALRTGKSEEVIKLLRASERSKVDPIILGAFLSKLRGEFGQFEDSANCKLLHQYEVGYRLEQLYCDMTSEDGTRIPIHASFQYGHLVSFGINSPRLAYFLDLIEDESCYGRIGKRFMQEWFSQSSDLAPLLDAELRTDEVLERLHRMKQDLVVRLGSLQRINVGETTKAESTNRVTLLMQLEHQRGQALVELELTIDAFTGLASGIQIQQR